MVVYLVQHVVENDLSLLAAGMVVYTGLVAADLMHSHISDWDGPSSQGCKCWRMDHISVVAADGIWLPKKYTSCSHRLVLKLKIVLLCRA